MHHRRQGILAPCSTTLLLDAVVAAVVVVVAFASAMTIFIAGVAGSFAMLLQRCVRAFAGFAATHGQWDSLPLDCQ